MTKRKRMHNQRTAKAVERKALALDAPSIPVPLMSDEQRLRIERRSVLDRITSNGTISACVMILAAIAAVICANTDAYDAIHEFIMRPVSIGIAGWEFTLTVELFVNDFLMAIFFLLVGTELKYEMTVGQLRQPRQAMLPMLAAVGGVIVPASIYAFVNRGGAVYGWAIPMATDIAFALGVMSLLGNRVPAALKVFFSTLAIADDLLAIVAIALFYGHAPSMFWLGAAAVVTGLLVLLNVRRHFRLAPYMLLGLVLWFCLYQSGVHATLAGVILAFTIPARSDIDAGGLVEWLQAKLPELDDRFDDDMHILGQHRFKVRLVGVDPATLLFDPVALGVYFGMLLGKPIGIAGMTFIMVKAHLAELPAGVRWPHIVGMGILGGIGFTMSILIAGLAFTEIPAELLAAKTAILAGSVSAAVIGLAFMALACRDKGTAAQR